MKSNLKRFENMGSGEMLWLNNKPRVSQIGCRAFSLADGQWSGKFSLVGKRIWAVIGPQTGQARKAQFWLARKLNRQEKAQFWLVGTNLLPGAASRWAVLSWPGLPAGAATAGCGSAGSGRGRGAAGEGGSRRDSNKLTPGPGSHLSYRLVIEIRT